MAIKVQKRIKKIAQLKKTYTKDQYAGFKTMCHQYYSSVSQEYSQKAFRSLLNIFANTKDGAIIFIVLKEKIVLV